ncbi:erythromycin esterase family protein [Streptomyces mayteni]
MNIEPEVVRWIDRHAHPFVPDAGAPLAAVVGDARVVAVGVACRATRELNVAAHRVVRLLVEELGFRTVVLEGDDPARLGLDAYVAAGAGGDPRAALAGARAFWQTEEVLAAIRWLREHNKRNPADPIRLAGSVGGGSAADRDALERSLAEGALGRLERAGDRVAYWGGLAHTAVTSPARTAGGHLRDRLGAGFVSLGMTFHHGRIPAHVPAPPPEFAEATLGAVDRESYLLDLRPVAPPPAVRGWLDAPATVRMIGPVYDPRAASDHRVSGDSLGGMFDAVLFTREVGPARPLPER